MQFETAIYQINSSATLICQYMYIFCDPSPPHQRVNKDDFVLQFNAITVTLQRRVSCLPAMICTTREMMTFREWRSITEFLLVHRYNLH